MGELIKTYHKNGNLNEEYHVLNGYIHGDYKQNHEDGTEYIRCYYINGKIEGTKTENDPDNEDWDTCITEYKDGECIYVKTYIDGELYEESPFKDNKKEGLCKRWDNGKIVFSCEYKDDKRHGTCIEIKGYNKYVSEYVNGKLNGRKEEYNEYSLCDVSYYKDDELHGTSIEYDYDYGKLTKIKIMNFAYGMYHGKLTVTTIDYVDDGKNEEKRISEICSYDCDMKHGLWQYKNTDKWWWYDIRVTHDKFEECVNTLNKLLIEYMKDKNTVALIKEY